MTQVLDELPVAMSVIDGDGRIILCNAATAMMKAKRSERFIQLRSFGPPDNRIAQPNR